MDGMTKAALAAAAFFTFAASAGAAETYSLVQATGNTEHISAKGLSKAECETRRDELKAVASALGTYSELTGRGSITCLPDSVFADPEG